jgi:hypothetical protein
MLEMLDGTEQYEALKQQFDEAAARAGSLPYEEPCRHPRRSGRELPMRRDLARPRQLHRISPPVRLRAYSRARLREVSKQWDRAACKEPGVTKKGYEKQNILGLLFIGIAVMLDEDL